MPSTIEASSNGDSPKFIESIRGKIALANLAVALVLLVVAAIATIQFRELGKTLGEVSDGTEVLMRLSHAYDERENLSQSFRKGYAGSDDAAAAARDRFVATAEDLARHASAARDKLKGGEGTAALDKAHAGVSSALSRSAGLGELSAEQREVALIEIEEGLNDSVGQIGLAKLEANRAMERRLVTVKVEIAKPERLFWAAAAAGALIALGISFFLRARVSRPIERLSLAVSALSRGEPKPVAIAGRDELARLAGAFNAMAETITERNRSLKLVLDNVGDGLLTCDLSGSISAEPSTSAVSWFGPLGGPTKVWDYLFSDDVQLREWFVLGFEQLVSGILPFETAAQQIPSEVRHGSRLYAVAFRPVLADGELSRILVVLTDVTEGRALAHKEREARDVYHLASTALRDPDAFTDFVADTNKRLARAAAGEDVLLELHTIKGNASVVGCDSFASLVHTAESKAVENDLGPQDLEELSRRWRELCETSEAAVGRAVSSAVVVPRSEYDRLCGLLAERRPREAELLARAWSMHRMESVFQRLSRTVEQYAARAGKRVRVESEGGELAVPRGSLDELWSCLVHLVKNTIAHGVERTEERIARGKPAEGCVRLHADARGDRLSVSVRDDGAGIDWEALGAGAKDARGRLDALARSGSSAREVTDVSGRGVGLSAARKVIEGLGGTISVSSERGLGTDFTATVPVSGVFRVLIGETSAAESVG